MKKRRRINDIDGVVHMLNPLFYTSTTTIMTTDHSPVDVYMSNNKFPLLDGEVYNLHLLFIVEKCIDYRCQDYIFQLNDMFSSYMYLQGRLGRSRALK